MQNVSIVCDTQSTVICPVGAVALDLKIETSDVWFAAVQILLRNEYCLICQVSDLDNIGDDLERKSVDQYII